MAVLSLDTNNSLNSTVTIAHAEFAAPMASGETWEFSSNTDAWVKQANPTGTITCVAVASLVDTDFMSINDGINAAVLYEFDVAGNGVTGGRVQVNVSTDTTAAQVAARLRTAILANQPYLTVVDNGNGTLSLSSTSRNITLTETVANAGFLVVFGPIATAGAGSAFVPARMPKNFSGKAGSNLSVLRDSADGKASLTRLFKD